MMKRWTKIVIAIMTCLTLTACGNTTESSNNTAKQDNDMKAKDTIVVYFSATGTTKELAEQLADGIDADIFEIVPMQPYTNGDLDYSNDNSRSTLEMNDPSSRPEIRGRIDNFDQYRNVIIGYPIWWSDAPRIMSTFVESYDFGGKTILPFCTSGGSGIGASAKNLETLAGSGIWLEGQRFLKAEDLINWVESNISE